MDVYQWYPHNFLTLQQYCRNTSENVKPKDVLFKFSANLKIATFVNFNTIVSFIVSFNTEINQEEGQQ